jgi:hypothetical protein
MYRLRPYEATDLLRADWRPRDKAEIANWGFEECNKLNDFYLSGPSYTLLWENQILLCAGVIIMWEGVGEAWFRGTNQMYQHKDEVRDRTIYVFGQLFKDNKFKRIQTTVQENWETARRFAEACGMKYEGRMPYYGMTGEHFVRYAITISESEEE